MKNILIMDRYYSHEAAGDLTPSEDIADMALDSSAWLPPGNIVSPYLTTLSPS